MSTMMDEYMREHWKEPADEREARVRRAGVRIIRPGKSKEELERIDRAPKVFKCRKCDCVFEADKRVYRKEQCGYNMSEYVCDCSNCGAEAREEVQHD